MVISIFLIFISFLFLWIGSGIAISAVEKLSRRVHISFFLVSFFALGLLTSLPEISVGAFSLINGTPNISVGNLIGASVVLTLLIIPLQVLISKGIPVNTKDDQINMPIAYLIISLPVVLILDGNLSTFDAVLMIFSYIYLLFTISNKRGLLEKVSSNFAQPHLNVYREVSKIVLGAVIIIVSSKVIVDNIVIISNFLNVSPFIIGLVGLALGTNVPEITFLIRSYINKKKSIALGDYIGSASLNTLLLGLLVFANGGRVVIPAGVKLNVLILPLGALLFLLFARNKKFEKKEAIFLIFIYAIFIFLEFVL